MGKSAGMDGSSRPPAERRIQRAEGYRWILVNGVVTFKDGVCTQATPGKLLRLNRWSEAEQQGRLASAG